MQWKWATLCIKLGLGNYSLRSYYLARVPISL